MINEPDHRSPLALAVDDDPVLRTVGAEALSAAGVKFQIQPDHFGIFGMRDDQGNLNDPQAARHSA